MVHVNTKTDPIHRTLSRSFGSVVNCSKAGQFAIPPGAGFSTEECAAPKYGRVACLIDGLCQMQTFFVGAANPSRVV